MQPSKNNIVIRVNQQLKMKNWFLIIVFVAFGKLSSAQDYTGSVGIRGGVSNGITYKIILFDEKAYEGILSFREAGIQITGLSVNHQPIFFEFSDKLFLYKGFGAHAGYYGRGRCRNNPNCIDRDRFSPSLGIDGIIGIEYRVIKFPMTAAIDFKPFIDILGRDFFASNFYDFALAVKYTF